MSSPDDGRRVRARWQAHVLAEVSLLRAEIDSEGKDCGKEARDAINTLLDQSGDAACFVGKNPFERMRSRVFGSAVESAYTSLHAARVLWARNCPASVVDLRLARARARLLAIAETTDRRAQILGDLLDELPGTPHEERAETLLAIADADDRRALIAGELIEESTRAPEVGRKLHEKRDTLAAAIEWIYTASDCQHARVRSFRNIVWAGTAALFFLAVTLGLLGWRMPGAIALCFNGDTGLVCPTGNSPSGQDIVVIELLGLLGGALSAIVAIRRSEGDGAVSYSVPTALAVLKLPVGAVSALSGLLLIHGQFIPGLTDLDTEGQILAYAFVFGLAQQLVTRLADRAGNDVLARVPDTRVTTRAAARAPRRRTSRGNA